MRGESLSRDCRCGVCGLSAGGAGRGVTGTGQTKGNQFRLSLRSKGQVGGATIAERFGGGDYESERMHAGCLGRGRGGAYSDTTANGALLALHLASIDNVWMN